MTKGKKKIKSTKPLTLDEVFEEMALTSSSPPGINNSIVLTPISSEACLRSGINPDHLRKRTFEAFQENNVDLEIQRLKYETYLKRREELMKIASKEKQKIRNGKCDQSIRSEAGSLTPSVMLEREAKAAATLLELEQKRLEKAKQRQKKELLQLLQFEQKMAQIQEDMRKKAEEEALAEERRRIQREKQERRAAEERRIRELRLRAQEEAEEEMHRVNARLRFEKERQFEIEKEQRMQEHKKRLQELEEERQRKAELLRIQLQNEELAKREEIERKLKEREEKELERQQRIERKRIHEQLELEKKKKQAAKRIVDNKNAAKRKEDERKKAVLEKVEHSILQQKRIQLEREMEREISKKEQEALSKRRQHQAKLARDKEDEMKNELLNKFEKNEDHVREVKAAKDKEMNLLRQERELQIELKRENVERIKRMQEYKRIETLKKLEEENTRVEEMLQKRDELANSRRKNAVEAKIRRDQLLSTIEKTKAVGGSAIIKILSQLEDGDDLCTKPVEKKTKTKAVLPSITRNKKSTSRQHENKVKMCVPPKVVDIKPAVYVSPYASSVR